MYRTIIFDLDGTLLNTLDDLMDAVNYILEKHGFPLRSREEIRHFVGNGIHVLMERAVPAGIQGEEFEAIFIEFKEYYTAHCKVKTKPYDGVMETLQRLKETGCQLAIVSNKNDAAVKSLAKIYFEDLIPVAIGEKPEIHKKPEPDTVFEAMRLLNAKKETTLYVGDSEVDLQTAENAGIDYALVEWGFRTKEELLERKPKRMIAKAQELLELVK